MLLVGSMRVLSVGGGSVAADGGSFGWGLLGFLWRGYLAKTRLSVAMRQCATRVGDPPWILVDAVSSGTSARYRQGPVAALKLCAGTWGARSLQRSPPPSAVLLNHSQKINLPFTKRSEKHLYSFHCRLRQSEGSKCSSLQNTRESTWGFLHLFVKVQECKFPKTFLDLIKLQILPSFKMLILTGGSWSSKKPHRRAVALAQRSVMCPFC